MSDPSPPVNPHKQALLETGFWGRAAAGGIILARSSQRFLLAHRGEGTLQAGTWGTWGGACDGDETPIETVRREMQEEAGIQQEMELHELYTFRHESGFSYTNFLAIIEEEFEPVLNWETQGFGWFEFNQWPDPLHFGTRKLIKDPSSLSIFETQLALLTG